MRLSKEILAFLLVHKGISFKARCGEDFADAMNSSYVVNIIGFDVHEKAYIDSHYDRHYEAVIPIDHQGEALAINSRFNADEIGRMIRQLALPSSEKRVYGSDLTRALIEIGASVTCTLSEESDDMTSDLHLMLVDAVNDNGDFINKNQPDDPWSFAVPVGWFQEC